MMSPRLPYVSQLLRNDPYVIKRPQSIRMQVAQSLPMRQRFLVPWAGVPM